MTRWYGAGTQKIKQWIVAVVKRIPICQYCLQMQSLIRRAPRNHRRYAAVLGGILVTGVGFYCRRHAFDVIRDSIKRIGGCSWVHALPIVALFLQSAQVVGER